MIPWRGSASSNFLVFFFFSRPFRTSANPRREQKREQHKAAQAPGFENPPKPTHIDKAPDPTLSEAGNLHADSGALVARADVDYAIWPFRTFLPQPLSLPDTGGEVSLVDARGVFPRLVRLMGSCRCILNALSRLRHSGMKPMLREHRRGAGAGGKSREKLGIAQPPSSSPGPPGRAG